MANAHKTGLVVGTVLGGWHLLWSILVALGWGQPLINFVLWAHMIHMQYNVGPFNVTAALTLVVLTAIVGYVIGYILAIIWNKFHSS